MTEYRVDKREVNPLADETLSLGEDEIIVETVERAPTRLVMYVLTPPRDVCGVCGCVGSCGHDCCGERHGGD